MAGSAGLYSTQEADAEASDDVRAESLSGSIGERLHARIQILLCILTFEEALTEAHRWFDSPPENNNPFIASPWILEFKAREQHGTLATRLLVLIATHLSYLYSLSVDVTLEGREEERGRRRGIL